MFTGVKSKNHRKGICNDGVWQVPKSDKDKHSAEDRMPPQWSQPAVILAQDCFSPLKFLATLRHLVVTDGVSQMNVPIEYQAFLGLLGQRIESTPSGSPCFILTWSSVI